MSLNVNVLFTPTPFSTHTITPTPCPLFLSIIPRTTFSPASIFATTIEAFQSRRSGIPALAGTDRVWVGDMGDRVSVCVARILSHWGEEEEVCVA
jgi:hypothetical protein